MEDYSQLRPELFRPGAIDEETAKFNEIVLKLSLEQPPLYTMSIDDARRLNDGTFPSAKRSDFQEREISGPGGKIPIRVYVPETVKGVYLHFHGGGYMFGSAEASDEANYRIANVCNVAIVSVDYRLAPENPYPAGLDDCEAVAIWLAGNSMAEFGAEVLLIGGESAGAALSVATLLRMRDRHGFTGFSGANLLYGGYDANMTPSQRNWGEERNLVGMTTHFLQWVKEHYAPPEKRYDPYVSPLYAELPDMPKALFTVGTLDPVLDDSLFMYMRWISTGIDAELAVYPGGCHAFNVLPTQLAKKANRKIRSFIKEIVDGKMQYSG